MWQAGMWKDVLKSHPENMRAQLGLGALALSSGDLDTAEQSFLGILSRLPRPVSVLPSPVTTLYSLAQTDLGVVYEQRGDYAKAEDCFREAVRVSLKNCDARVNLGIVLSRVAPNVESKELWLEVLAIEPHHEKARFCLGWSALRAGDVSAGVEHLNVIAEGSGAVAEQARQLLLQVKRQQ